VSCINRRRHNNDVRFNRSIELKRISNDARVSRLAHRPRIDVVPDNSNPIGSEIPGNRTADQP
jgi:hypothetical protein